MGHKQLSSRGVQASLDVAGLVPGVGEIADGVNALISLGRGDVAGATFSATSMLPIVGDAIGRAGRWYGLPPSTGMRCWRRLENRLPKVLATETNQYLL